MNLEMINERLRLLMAVYKTLGGSFTGDLSVDPAHLCELRQLPGARGVEIVSSSDRSRCTREAVESALSDIILLGTEEQVRLAGLAAQELVEGRQDWMVKLNRPTIDEIICVHLPDGSIRIAGGL
jgi:hypothetical protein